MTRVGITGHLTLTEQAKRPPPDAEPWRWVERELRRTLSRFEALTGISALALGADQLFARIVLDRGGKLEVTLPFPEYEGRIREEKGREQFESLLKRAAVVTYALEKQPPGPDIDAVYAQTGRLIVDSSEEMVAVWERGREGVVGSTKDIVEYVRQRNKPLVIIDPRRREVSAERVRRAGHARA